MGTVAGVDDDSFGNIGSIAPSIGWRITMASQAMDCTVSIVSRRHSPFTTLELEVVMFTTSAPRYFPASSKEVRVLVLGS
mgnify:CR=1 FL=1